MNPHRALIEAAERHVANCRCGGTGLYSRNPDLLEPFDCGKCSDLRAAISSAKAAEEGVGLQIVDPKIQRVPQPYVRTRGSGWFWCHHKVSGEMWGWSVLYINALWGAQVTNGTYVRTDNFDDVVGPLAAPETVISLREKEGL